MNFKQITSKLSILILIVFCQTSYAQRSVKRNISGEYKEFNEEKIIAEIKAARAKQNSEQQWKQINKNFWISKEGKIGFRTYKQLPNDSCEIFIEKVDDGVEREGRKVVFLDLTDKIDTATFIQVNEEFFKDKNTVYKLSFLDESFFIVSGVDANTFEVLNDCYYKDKFKIYTKFPEYLSEDFDDETFITSDNKYCLAVDKRHIYYYGRVTTIKSIKEGDDKERIKEMLSIIKELQSKLKNRQKAQGSQAGK
jgi:hypothetical protein